jgi:hypothetical protein
MGNRERFALNVSVFAYVEFDNTVLMLRRSNTGGTMAISAFRQERWTAKSDWK